MLAVTYRHAELRSGSVAAWCATGLLATNFTFIAFGTSGLETMLQTALLAAAAWQIDTIRREAVAPTPSRLAAVSALGALAIWTRLDSGVIGLVFAAALAHHLAACRASARHWFATIVPVLVLVGGWLAWKLDYYGGIIPNSAHAKLGLSVAAVEQGGLHILRFLHVYALWPFVLLALVLGLVKRTFVSLPSALVAIWLLYVAAVGGDFMEFRFFVPILPALALVISGAVSRESVRPWLQSPRLRAALTVVVLAIASVRHAVGFVGVAPDFSYDSIGAMRTFYGKVSDGDWGRLGRPLHDA